MLNFSLTNKMVMQNFHTCMFFQRSPCEPSSDLRTRVPWSCMVLRVSRPTYKKKQNTNILFIIYVKNPEEAIYY